MTFNTKYGIKNLRGPQAAQGTAPNAGAYSVIPALKAGGPIIWRVKMEDLSIIQYIANYGMPAVMSVVLIVMLYNERKDNKEEQRRMRETIDGLKDVVKDNTSLMQTIKQMIEDLLK